jgi:hypothetical protein
VKGLGGAGFGGGKGVGGGVLSDNGSLEWGGEGKGWDTQGKRFGVKDMAQDRAGIGG